MSSGLHARVNRTIDGVLHKRCSKCLEWKPRATYQKKGERQNVVAWCRACQAAFGRAYSKANYVPRPRRQAGRPRKSIDATGETLAQLWVQL